MGIWKGDITFWEGGKVELEDVRVQLCLCEGFGE